jgi:hypothetical protein
VSETVYVTDENTLSYIPSGHDHTDRAGQPRRWMDDLVKLARSGSIAKEHLCWIEAPGHPETRVYYTLRLRGTPYKFAFYAGKPEDNGPHVACFPSEIVKDFYKNQKRMAGWCALHMADHDDMPLCTFRDQHIV